MGQPAAAVDHTVGQGGHGEGLPHVGDDVVGFLPMDADGAAAQYVLAPAQVLTAAPRSVPLPDAAALPTVGLTAWQGLFEIAKVTAGQRILINGAGGAVGGYAVQLAKQAGAFVTATATPRSADRLRRYGADRIIDHVDYAAAPITLDGAPFDVVFNLVSTSPEETAALVDVVADGGQLVGTMTAGPDDAERHVRAQRMFVRSDAAQLAELVRRVDSGALRIDVADRRALTDAPTVHADSDAGRLRGKVVLIPVQG
jgi:NADPH:quinone reductase-like Zn-dependent oxidoreductase